MDRPEVLVSGEGRQRGGPVDVLGTLLHEAAHGLARPRKVSETSRQGRYHNRRYATLARELGLDVAQVQPIGWSATSVPEHTATRYTEVLAELAAALVLWRRAEEASLAGPLPPRPAPVAAAVVSEWPARSSSRPRSCAPPARNRPSPRTTRNVDAYPSTDGMAGALNGWAQP
jgi:hypothetical protein